MELFSKEAAGLERHDAPLAGPVTEWERRLPNSLSAISNIHTIIILPVLLNSIGNRSSSTRHNQYAGSESRSILDCSVQKALYSPTQVAVHENGENVCRQPYTDDTKTTREFILLVIDNFHIPVLLNP